MFVDEVNADVAAETYRPCILQSLRLIEKVCSDKAQCELKAKWRDAEGRKVVVLPVGSNSRKKAANKEATSTT